MVFKAVKECYGEETVLPMHGAPDMEEEVGSFDIPGIRGGYDVKRGCLYIFVVSSSIYNYCFLVYLNI